jgi:Ca-activated chloride channel family protein
MLRKLLWLAVLPLSLPGQESQQPVVIEPAAQAQSKLSETRSKSVDEDQEAITTIRKRVDEVSVIFTVTDKHGRFVRNLAPNDILVTDDNKPPQEISSFRNETDLPLRVGLLIDASNSVRDRFRFEQEAAIQFLNQIVRLQTDKALVLGFDTTPEITQELTDDPERLARGVRVLRPGGGTAMYDAIYFACRDRLLNSGKKLGAVRKALILISDGDDNQSRVTREEAVEMAQRAEVIIYAISTNISGMKMRGDKILERFAEATGGRVFFPFKLQDVADAFTQIQDELRSQYVLSYRPTDLQLDGRFRTIEIAVASNKKLRARARKAYFAPKE